MGTVYNTEYWAMVAMILAYHLEKYCPEKNAEEWIFKAQEIIKKNLGLELNS